jgi:hypothetical protein
VEYLVGLAVVVVLFVAYTTWLASRIDRLHARVSAAYAALDAQLARRATAAAQLAHRQRDARPEVAEEVCAAVTACLEAEPDHREAVENDLTRALAGLRLHPDDPAVVELRTVNRRLVVARQVYNDAVRDTLGLRGQRLPRAMRLGARRETPCYFDIAEFNGDGVTPIVGEATPGAS